MTSGWLLVLGFAIMATGALLVIGSAIAPEPGVQECRMAPRTFLSSQEKLSHVDEMLARARKSLWQLIGGVLLIVAGLLLMLFTVLAK